MRILFIRHCEPDYQHDSLTQRGFQEAELLRQYLKDRNLGEIYVSPLGRAQKTAQAILRDNDRTAVTLDWLREANVTLDLRDNGAVLKYYPDSLAGKEQQTEERCYWDIIPRQFWEDPYLMDNVNWRKAEICRFSNLPELYDQVTTGFDELLAGHGYQRQDKHYRVIRGNHDTLTLICHLGVSALLLSHLNNMSPFMIPQFTCAAPSSLTEVVSEERSRGIAMFRTLTLGATPHLTLAGQPVSFSARFCECYEDDARH